MKRHFYSTIIKYITFCIFITFLVASCAARYNRYGLPQYDYEYQVPQQLDDGWQTSTLETEDVDSGKINEMMGKIMDGDIDNIHGIVVIKNGKLILEEYFDGFDRDTRHRIFSASKSVTSIFAEKNLFAPLGIADYSWDKGPKGVLNTAGGLWLKPRDMAKIGYLYLHKGQWNGRQIVSQKWVKESVADHVNQYVTFGSGYGYQWWCGKSKINGQTVETYYAAGHGGQYIFVYPALECVTVITSKWIGNSLGELRPQMLLVNYILPAMLPPSSSEVINPGPSILEKYAGEYEFPKWKLKATVRRQGNKLYIDLPKSTEKEVRPLAINQFSYPLKGYGDVRIDFNEDGTGEITQMVAYFGYANITFWKKT